MDELRRLTAALRAYNDAMAEAARIEDAALRAAAEARIQAALTAAVGA